MKFTLIIILYIGVFIIGYYTIEYVNTDVIRLTKENEYLTSIVEELKKENTLLKEEIKELSKSKEYFTIYQSLFAFSIITIVIILYLTHKTKK